MMPYFTDCGPRAGPIRRRSGYIAIGVMQAVGSRPAVGVAVLAGETADGISLWTLTVGGAELPKEWVVVDREFRQAP